MAVLAPASIRTTAHIREILSGRRRGIRAVLPLAGPAVIASVAYMDPGNIATNIQAGAKFGFGLLWVVVLANAVAMFYQALSAKLGIVSNQSLAELCRDHFPQPIVYAMWIASEIAAMATDLAEFVGAAVGLSLLFHLPIAIGMLVTAVLTYVILAIEPTGFRKIELVIGAFVVVIGACYLVELFVVPPGWSTATLRSMLPQLDGPEGFALAAGIVGATIMPHVIFLHSGLTKDRAPARSDAERRKLVRYSNREVVIALSIAGLVNMAMVVTAATAFHAGHRGVAQIETAYVTMIPLFGAAAGVAFLISLLASGISSSVVGTMAGQMIMAGFTGVRIPLWLRRSITIVPAFIVIGLGVNVTTALVFSQVVLSIVLPLPMIALLMLSSKRTIMGQFVAGRGTLAVGVCAVVAIVILNAALIAQY